MSKICGTSFIDEHPRPGVTCTNTLITYAFTHVLMRTRQKNRARVAARDAYTYHIDELPPQSAVGRCFDSSSSLPGSARVQERERETTERGSWRPGQNGTRDKRIRTEIRERGREIGSVSERKSAKGKNEGTRGEDYTEAQRARRRCIENTKVREEEKWRKETSKNRWYKERLEKQERKR